MEQFQGPGACLVVERIIREGTDDASQEKGQSCLFVLERYRERSRRKCIPSFALLIMCFILRLQYKT